MLFSWFPLLHPAQALLCLLLLILEFLAEILLWENGSAPSIPEPYPSNQQRDHVDQWLWGRRASLRLERQEHRYLQEAGGLLCKTAQSPSACPGFFFWHIEGGTASLRETVCGISSLRIYWFFFVLFCFSLVFDCQNTVGLSTMWQPFESRLNISWKIILTLSHLCILLTLETSFINTVHWGLVITCSLCMHGRPGDLNQVAQFSLLGLMQGLAIPVCGPDLFTR